MWTETRDGRRWERKDGAVVKWDDSSPYPNPILASARMWTAWEPDPSTTALVFERGWRRYQKSALGDMSTWRPRVRRRWKTAQAAMVVVDREYPMEEKDAQS